MVVHLLVPGAWTVAQGHQLAEQVEVQVRTAIPNLTVATHVEPIEDPISLQDAELDRK